MTKVLIDMNNRQFQDVLFNLEKIEQRAKEIAQSIILEKLIHDTKKSPDECQKALEEVDYYYHLAQNIFNKNEKDKG